ncbi:hypothetical protein ACFQ1E_14475 [Sphingomonas canadensis]|uniref:Protoheme IX farnesyltransferase n=1 Tax=Sphingomonas canadensis TaxID=1219257 RepID=A0ABW3H7R8_9SPHN|nr:hypothetical protein [Sphingomonas canadensis]MCW3837211.1 hypothetical protein [Sphingomonas canadensis]
MTQDETPLPGTDAHTREVRARQASRARVMALLLGAFVILVFAIAIAKMTGGAAH